MPNIPTVRPRHVNAAVLVGVTALVAAITAPVAQAGPVAGAATHDWLTGGLTGAIELAPR
jgi:hypothetical protein